MSSLLVESNAVSALNRYNCVNCHGLSWTVDVVSVTKRVCGRQHQLSGVTLGVVMLDSQPDVEVCAVQVSGVLASHTDEFISLYFESSKRSGGGPIDELVVDHEKGTAVITFTSPLSMILSCHVLSVLMPFLFL